MLFYAFKMAVAIAFLRGNSKSQRQKGKNYTQFKQEVNLTFNYFPSMSHCDTCLWIKSKETGFIKSSILSLDIEGSKSYGLNSTTQQSLFCPVQSAANSTRAIPSLGSPLALYYIVVLLTPALELVKGLERIKFSFHFTQKPLLCLFNEL